MKRVMSALLVASLCVAGSWATAVGAVAHTGTTAGAKTTADAKTAAGVGVDPRSAGDQDVPSLLTPYDPAKFTDLYRSPDGVITGATYIFNPTVDWRQRMVFDFARMRQVGINTVGLYNLVQMTDGERDALFAALAANRQKAVVRIEWYDRKTFSFDGVAAGHRDADSVLRYYNSDDRAHGYTALLDYLKRRDRLGAIAYFAVNMPVDDGMVSDKFASATYPDGRANPRWAASQPPYVDHLLAGLRSILGGPDRAKLYLSVFYGWDQTYPTPSYAGIAHPADGYFLNNYSYPAGAPVDERASTADRLNQPRLQSAMDRLVDQYPSQPKVIEYGFHTADFNGGVIPNQTAGLVRTVAAKRLALAETTAYYANGSSGGVPFRVRGTLYFAGNLFKPEGNPPAVMDWALGNPGGRAEAENGWATQYYRDGAPIPVQPLADSGASGGRAVTLAAGETMSFINLTGASVVEIRYRAGWAVDAYLSVNGATARTVRLPAATGWRTTTVNVAVPLQGTVTLRRSATGGPIDLDWVGAVADYEAELAGAVGAVPVSGGDASRGAAMILPANRASSLTVEPVRGGTRVRVRYAAAAPVRLSLRAGGAATTLDLPATGGADRYATSTAAADVRSGAALLLGRAPAAGDVAVDSLRVDGLYEAESSGGLYNGVYAVPLAGASEGALATWFDVVGASVVFSAVVPGNRLTFGYSSTRATSMTIILNEEKTPVAFPATGGALARVSVPLTIPANATVIVERQPTDVAVGLSIDWLSISG